MSANLQATSARPLRIFVDGVQPSDRRAGVLRALLDKGYCVTAGFPAENASLDGRSHVLVLADHPDGDTPRADGSGDPARVEWLAIQGMEPDAVLESVAEAERTSRAVGPGAWYPWFPVIDFQRCTNCMQCLSFCLFDVYGVDENKDIQVKNPQNCKTNCPACSRVCPEVAILFPKYRAAPINGAEVQDADVAHEKMKTDISALLGGDIYEALRERHRRAASRFARERDPDKALKERVRCLKKLQGAIGDIPPEVLMALPSIDQIAQKAAAAHAAAEKARHERAELEGTGGD